MAYSILTIFVIIANIEIGRIGFSQDIVSSVKHKPMARATVSLRMIDLEAAFISILIK